LRKKSNPDAQIQKSRVFLGILHKELEGIPQILAFQVGFDNLR